jgi:hypothetical protein
MTSVGSSRSSSVVQILVAQRDREDALPDQGCDRVLDECSRAAIAKTAGKPVDKPDRLIGAAQRQRPGSRSGRAAVEIPTISRPSARANPNRSALHSVGIGGLP